MVPKIYQCALYARLSKEDGDKPESDSIVNQIKMLESYCNKYDDLAIQERYFDDGYTGTNFERPGFRQMLCDAESGKIDCIGRTGKLC